jgi:hypothetical protein
MAEAEELTPVWTIAANVVRHRRYGEGGQELRPGTKAFRGGAKVYLPDGYPGMGYEQIIAIGYGRNTRRYIAIAVALRHLHTFRAALVHSPAVLRLIEDGHHTRLTWPEDKDTATERAADFERLARRYREEHWAGVAHPPRCLCVDCLPDPV